MTILEMNHVSKAFGGSKALSDIHFSVEEGEIHALLGENGIIFAKRVENRVQIFLMNLILAFLKYLDTPYFYKMRKI